MVQFFTLECSCWRSRENIPRVGRTYEKTFSIEAIDFQTSGNIILRGYHLWKDNSLFPNTIFTIELYQGNITVAKKSHTYDSRFSNKKTFEVYFPREIYLQAGVNYTAAVRIMGRKYYAAQNRGISNNVCSGVNVVFKKSSLGRPVLRSYMYVRQIPALIFLSLKC